MAGEAPFDFHDHRSWNRPVIAPDDRLPFAQVSRDATDVASPSELLCEVESLGTDQLFRASSPHARGKEEGPRPDEAPTGHE